MPKGVILTFLIALMVIPIVVASEYEYLYNPYTGKLDRTRSSNQTGQNMSLGAVDINADGIALSVSNSTGGTVLKVNTTSGKLEVWHPSEGAGDYVSIAHDGSNGYIRSASGDLQFGLGAVSYWRLFTSAFYPAVVNSYDLGAANNEVRGIYLGNGTGSSGIYLGLGQENHIWAEDATLKLSTNDFQVWDDALGANDYVSISHDGTDGILNTASGDLIFQFLGSNKATLTSSGMLRVGGATTDPAMGLHVGTGSSSHSLTNVNDTLISGQLEVNSNSFFDGTSYFYSTVNLIDDAQYIYGTSWDSSLDYSTAQATANTLVWGLADGASQGNSLIFTTKTNRNVDHLHPSQTSPTTFWHSATSPTTNSTQWGSIAHDTSSFVIDSGTDSIVLDDTTTVAGNLNLGDNILGDDKFRMCYNGSESVMDMYSNNGSLFSCSVNNTGSFICSSVSTWSCT